MHDVALLDLDVVGVHPVYKFFGGVQLLQNLMLLLSIVPLNLLLRDALFQDEFGLVG